MDGLRLEGMLSGRGARGSRAGEISPVAGSNSLGDRGQKTGEE
jgi:hypothetical protein